MEQAGWRWVSWELGVGSGWDCILLILILSSIVGIGAAQENYANKSPIESIDRHRDETVPKKIVFLLWPEVYFPLDRDRVFFCTCTVCDNSLCVYTSYLISIKLSRLLRRKRSKWTTLKYLAYLLGKVDGYFYPWALQRCSAWVPFIPGAFFASRWPKLLNSKA